MPSLSFKSSVSVTHITTATAILSIDDKGDFEQQGGFVLTKTDDPALGLEDLPVIHAVLLSHEDHIDNLDTSGRTMLNGRHVFTTPRTSPHAQVFADSHPVQDHGNAHAASSWWRVHGLRARVAFVRLNEADGLPNVVYVSGDTVHIPELATELPKKYHVVVAFMNLGKAIAPLPTGPVQITMGGVQAAQLTRDIGAEKMVPLHFESWKHFTESGDDVRAELAADAAVKDKVVWVVPGEKTTVV
ncbi:Metallo-beta-lactamase [Phytophthora cactorum]|nr:Metallo-beta-lactamase [Phytophthora cactorum]